MLDWMEAVEVLNKYWHNSPQVDDEQNAEEGKGLISTNAENLFIVCLGVGLCAGVELLNVQTINYWYIHTLVLNFVICILLRISMEHFLMLEK